MPVQGENYTP